jgi:hypothetical protein
MPNGSGIFSCEAILTNRTPTEFRNFYNEWKKTAPVNDSDIIPDKPRVSPSPRHAGMCDDLKSMLAWKALHEIIDPLQTNYLQPGKFDVIFDEDGSNTSVKLDTEGNLKEQSAEEIMKALADVLFKKSYDNVISSNEHGFLFTYLRERLIPDLDATENHEQIKYWYKGQERERERIGFGELYESAIFGVKMKSVNRLGSVTLSDTDLDSRHPLGSVTRFGPGQWGKPVVRRTPKELSGSFSRPPEVQLFNPLERLIRMEDAMAANDNLDPEHASVLDAAITSPNFETVGNRFGFTGKTAERQGKRLTMDACKAFSQVLERLAA